jgi:uncharacterized membrane protein HdeD (DUF308 family)
MVENARRMTPRTEFLIGLAGALVGVLMIVVSRVADVRWMLIVGVVLVVLGAFATIARFLPERKTGTRLWENDPGSFGGSGG